MEITEILQVLEGHRDSLRRTMEILKELTPTPERMTSFSEFAREAQAFEEAAAILRQVPDQGPLTLEQLRKMDGMPVWVTPAGFFALVIAKRGKRVELICNDGERVYADKEIELVGPVYACPPAHIGREAWVSVEERLPDNEKPVLAYYGFYREDDDLGARFIGTLTYFCYDPEPHWKHESTGLFVTHWMPLPEPPGNS